jgi:hypothetical protein
MMRDLRASLARPCWAALALALGAQFVAPLPGASRRDERGHAQLTAAILRGAGAVSYASRSERVLLDHRPAGVAPTVIVPLPEDRLDVFRGLGAWVDLYDFRLNPRATVARLARHGVGTLYIQTGRSNTAYGLDPRSGAWLREAHRAGLRVVGWYLPTYADVRLDLRRTVAIQRARFGADRFDGLGIDIEVQSAVRSHAVWNRRVVALSTLVRRAVGPRYPVAAIQPPPLQMRLAPRTWAGYPWRSLAGVSDTMMLMSYWSYRRDCPQRPLHCPYRFTRQNVALTRRLTGRPDVLVHVIGGVGSDINPRELAEFVRAAKDARADGASIYDVATTASAFWPQLSALRALGDGTRDT